MSALEKAVAEVRAAEQQAQQLQLIAAVLQAQQMAQQQPACGCQHGHQAPASRSSWTPGKVAAAAGAVCVCGGVATMFFLSVAIAAPSIAASLLVLWKLYQAVMGGRRG